MNLRIRLAVCIMVLGGLPFVLCLAIVGLFQQYMLSVEPLRGMLHVEVRELLDLYAMEITGLAGLTAISSVAMAVVCWRQMRLGYLEPLQKLAACDAGECDADDVTTVSDRLYRLQKQAERAWSRLDALDEHISQTEKLVLVGKLAASVAHSVRNPLTSVKMRLYSLSRAVLPEGGAGVAAGSELAVVREDLDVIGEEIAHIDSILSNFLEFSRPPKMDARPVSLSDVTDTCVRLLRHRLESGSVSIRMTRVGLGEDGRLPLVLADPERLKEGLVNIILNGADAMHGGGHMTIVEEVCEVDGATHACIRVRDTGPGIVRAHRERLFEPFFTTKDEGTGLGLAITRRIVREHGGQLLVDSVEGGGATFTIALPLAQDDGGHAA